MRSLHWLWASQVVLMVKNLPANAGDIKDSVLILDQEDAMEGGMATHFSIFVWKNPMDRGAWQATVHGFTKKSNMT